MVPGLVTLLRLPVTGTSTGNGKMIGWFLGGPDDLPVSLIQNRLTVTVPVPVTITRNTGTGTVIFILIGWPGLQGVPAVAHPNVKI